MPASANYKYKAKLRSSCSGSNSIGWKEEQEGKLKKQNLKNKSGLDQQIVTVNEENNLKSLAGGRLVIKITTTL